MILPWRMTSGDAREKALGREQLENAQRAAMMQRR